LYVGPRLAQHRAELRRGTHQNRGLQEAWTDWGEAAFEFKLVERVSAPELLAAEQRWIAAHAAREPGHGFNVADPLARNSTEESFLDAAERLLVEIGYAKISTRRLGEEAGANHGLIHYYFGSMEQLFMRVLERYTDRLIERQRAMYAAPIPFIEKWRTA